MPPMAPQRGQHGPKDRPQKQQAASKRAQNRKQAVNARNVNGEASSGAISDSQLAQKILDTFIEAFPHLLEPDNVERELLPALQKIKTHLFNREFDAAFGCNEFLEAYTVRWSPSRALCYVNVFYEALRVILADDDNETAIGARIANLTLKEREISRPQGVKITCLGGCAAELVDLAAVPQVLPLVKGHDLHMTLIDRAEWSVCLDTLYKSMAGAVLEQSSQQASGPSVANDRCAELVLNSNLSYSFHQMDLLNLSPADASLFEDKISQSSLVTLMFTLNELYSSSIASTQSLLLQITSLMPSGSLLLVVDSAGSYSTVTMNQKEKRYPMQWLLDYTLMKFAPKALQAGGAEKKQPLEEETVSSTSSSASPAVPLWELVTSTDSRWYRLPELTYPVELENMRYQQHLYRRL